jgi:beta-mannosidase
VTATPGRVLAVGGTRLVPSPDPISPLRDGQVLRLEHPELWWPAGLGAQHLYTVESVLVPPGSRPEPRASGALDRRAQRIGLRTLRLVRAEDRFGQSFELEVNSRRIWAVGANWIPDSSFPSAVTRERVFAQLERARDMNMNMLRVWGGGLYESDDFYDAADVLGILVWQDFPYACSYYPDGESAQAIARHEAASAVRRLRNRASLALWCGNNENLTMFESKWGEPGKHPPRCYGERIYEQVLPALLAELDPERPYIPTSPWGGTSSNSGGVGDQHYWDVWHGRGDWKFYQDSGARFASEFGFAAAPGHAAFRRIAGVPGAGDALRLPVRDRAARWHDKTAKGYDTFIGYVELHYPPSENVEEWSYRSQLNQRDALRFGIEHYRRSEFCKGALIWQLNDCWPGQSWAVIDGELEYKAAAYELRRLYAPALVSLELDGVEARVWAVLDNTHEPVVDRVAIEARSSLDGRSLRAEEARVTLAPGTRALVLSFSLAGLEPETTLLSASFAGTSTCRLLCEPKQLRLSAPRLSAARAANGVVLESDVPVVDLFLWDPESGARFDPNFVTLPAGGKIFVHTTVAVQRLEARSLRGRHTVAI